VLILEYRVEMGGRRFRLAGNPIESQIWDGASSLAALLINLTAGFDDASKRSSIESGENNMAKLVATAETRGAFLVALVAPLVLGVAPHASAQMKQGAYKGTYASYGTYTAVPIGQVRLQVSWDETAQQLTDGFADHTTWHCWGTGDYTNGMGQDLGHCVGTDPAGDQLVNSTIDETHALDAKTFSGTNTWTGRTGKFAGASGGGTFLCHSGEKTAAEGTYVNYCTFEGSYMLP
jgi:hypothetical protein